MDALAACRRRAVASAAQNAPPARASPRQAACQAVMPSGLQALTLPAVELRPATGSRLLAGGVCAGSLLVLSQQYGLMQPFLCAAALTAAALGACIPLLAALRQTIRSTGPASHRVKAGTPTAAGVVFVPVACVVALVFDGSAPVLLAAGVVLLATACGLLDDVLSARPTEGRRGLSVRQKLALQATLGVVTGVAALSLSPSTPPALVLPGLALPLPALAYGALSAFTQVSEVNAVNLTDGLDGLGASCSALALSAAAVVVAPSNLGLATFCAAMAGAACGFLLWNKHPAAVFMGDAGAQALGASFACVAAFSGHFGAVAALSVVFIAETLSVIAQVGYRRWTKARTGTAQRLLRMAPLHHHFEMLGVPEVSITACAAALQCAAVVAVLHVWC